MPAAIGFALFQAGASLAVVNFVTIGFGATLINAAIGIGLSLAANALFRPNLGGQNAVRPSDGQVAIRQAVPERIKSYGRVRVGGPVWWWDVDPATSQFYIGQALNHGRIEGVDQFYIDDNPVDRNAGTGAITTAPYSTTPVPFNIKLRLGAATETAYSEINSIFGVSEVRGDGVATMLSLVDNFADPGDQLEAFPNNAPNVTALITPVAFDSRDGGQDHDDPTTWEFSENVVAAFVTYCIDPEGFGLPWSMIEPNLAEIEAEADICDEEIDSISGGGLEALYRVGGTYKLTERPADIAAKFMRCCDGRFWQKRDGTLGISVGRFRTPTVTIADRDIIAIDLTRGQDRLTRVAGMRAQFMSPQHLYREQDAEAWPTGAILAEVGDDRLANLDLTWVPSHSQCRRLMKRYFLREDADWRGTIQTNLSGMRALDERFIHITIDELGIDEPFEVQKFTLDLSTMTVSLDVLSMGAEVDEWNAGDEEGTSPSIITGPVFIANNVGTIIGDLTSNGGTAASFDGETEQDSGDCSARDSTQRGYVGKTFSSGKRFAKAVVFGSENEGFWINSSPSTTINIRGKNGAAPSGPTNGTIVGTVTFNDAADESEGREITSIDTVTAYDHLFAEVVRSSGSGNLRVAEVMLWEQQG